MSLKTMMIVSIAAFSMTSVALAQEVSTKAANSTRVLNYWTTERLQSAKPMTLPQRGMSTNVMRAQEAHTDGEQMGAPAMGPSVRIQAQSVQMFTPLHELNTEDGTDDSVTPQDSGFGSTPYSSQPLVPRTARTTFPYRAVGRLFFTTPFGNSWCSASVIRQRIVVTAGHCVHPGTSGSAFYTNHLFVPAYDNGTASFGSWTFAFLRTSVEWATGGGGVPNSADWALLEANDQVISGAVRRVAQVTGSLGYVTNSLLGNHLHTLGFPQNLDNGDRMRQITAEVYGFANPNCGELGSNMRGGSSGGPWIQNFAGDCQLTGSCGLNPNSTQVVAVTSYGPTSTSLQFQGASIFDNRFISLLSAACARRAGNC